MKTTPFPHQRQIFADTRSKNSWALLLEQGCGKSKVAIDTFFDMIGSSDVDSMLVIAPNGVHRNWIEEELPRHAWDEYFAFVWDSSKKLTQKSKSGVTMCTFHPGPAVLAMTYEGFMTKEGQTIAYNFISSRSDTLLVLDESHKIKNPSAKRTKAILRLGKAVAKKRILTGTPVTKSPLDIYSQIMFLDPQFWKDRGYRTKTAFDATFANFKMMDRYKIVTGFKNLDVLKEHLGEISSRVTKDEVLSDLPPKVYTKMSFDMEGAQGKAYRQVKDECLAFLESGEMVSAPLVVQRLMKLQQITNGFLIDDEGLQHDLPNPRIKLLEEITSNLDHQAIIWCRFTADVENVIQSLGERVRTYTGGDSPDVRKESLHDFRSGEAQFLVATSAASTGLTLNEAKTAIYYSNDFNLETRLQSEDRCHRIGQHNSVNYIDLVCSGTIDEQIVKALRSKVDLASQVTGDELREWI